MRLWGLIFAGKLPLPSASAGSPESTTRHPSAAQDVQQPPGLTTRGVLFCLVRPKRTRFRVVPGLSLKDENEG